MMTLPYVLNMAEAEGLLDTRESAIQNVIKRTKDYPKENISNLEFYVICEECGIQAGSLTNAEIAEKLQISKKTVENHLNLALKELKNALLLFIFLYLC